MSDIRFFTVKTFSRIARTTRDILHNYDKIGLLSPIIRGENHYRYYSSRQLTVFNIIHTLRELGMTLTEIKKLKEHRTPELVNETFSHQMKKIDKKIDDWTRAKKLLLMLQKTIRTTLNIDEKAITIQWLPAEAIVLGDLNDYSERKDDYDVLSSFYDTIGTRYPDLDLNYPVWAIFSKEQIKRGDWVGPDRYYFYNSEGRDERPAGMYAIGYARGRYGQNKELYERLVEYIDKNGFEICGDAYEEYPLNEVCVSDENNYLIRVIINVRKLTQI